MFADLPILISRGVTDIHNVLSNTALLWSLAAQAVLIGVCLGLLALFGPRLKAGLEQRVRVRHSGPTAMLLAALARVAPWALFALVMFIGRLSFHEAGWHARLIHFAENLALAWVVIRLTSKLVRNRGVSTAIAVAAWVIAALNIVGLLGPTVQLLDTMSLMVGSFRLSALIVIKGAFLLAVLLWSANTVSRVLEHRLQNLKNVAPATQVLATKLAKIVLLGLAVVISLNAVGIDLTAFAVLSGAIGVGVGFGLQKVVSNLISGVILLLDRSIKPGDVIEIDGTYGWITRLNARFVSVSTRDGIEHLVPNEDLITHRVTNWSYTNDLVRLKVPVGIGYGSDVRAAIALCIEAAEALERVLKTPKPICLVTGFGDNSVNLEVRFWIRDPRNGTANVRSDVMLGIWDRFHEHDVALPFPQRDIHLPELDALAEKMGAAFAAPPAGGGLERRHSNNNGAAEGL